MHTKIVPEIVHSDLHQNLSAVIYINYLLFASFVSFTEEYFLQLE